MFGRRLDDTGPHALCVRRIVAFRAITVDIVYLDSDQVVPTHKHHHSTSVLWGLRGGAVVSIGEAISLVNVFKWVAIRRGVSHKLVAGASGARLLAVSWPRLEGADWDEGR